MIIRRGEPNERPSHVKRVFRVGLAGLLIAALLNAGSILERSEQKPFGAERDAWVTIWKPVEWVSSLLFLDQPHQWIDESIGRGDGGDQFVLPAPDETPEPGDDGDPEGNGAQQPQPTATPGVVREPSAAEPLDIWAGGDSQAQVFGQSLVALAEETGVIDIELDYRISSGLTRPDYFNWPGHLADVAETESPEVMVLIFGANDSQGIETAEGDIFQPGEPGWAEEYRHRVAGTMDVLDEGGRVQYWVGQPIAESAGYSQRLQEMNTIFREEAEARASVYYVDAWELFTDENGNYSGFLPDGSGTPVDMRQGDGIHLTREGGDRLATAVLEAIGDRFAIGPPYSD